MLTITELNRLTALITDHRTCVRCLIPGIARTIVPVTRTSVGWVHDEMHTGMGRILDADYDHRALPSADDAPGSRYRRDIADWSIVAAAYAYVVGYETATDPDDLIAATDHHTVVGDVVNGDPIVALTLIEHRHLITRAVTAELGGIRRLRELARD